MNHPLRFARLGFCHLACRDLAASTAFYRDLVGLEVACEGGETVRLRCSDKPFDLLLSQGEAGGIVGAGFEMESPSELQPAFELLAGLDASPRWVSDSELERIAAERALHFTDPVSGLGIYLYAGQAHENGYSPAHTRIARLGHLVLNVTDLEAAHRFWVDGLGFAVSDRVEGVAEWLRCWPNPLHHSLALLQHDANTLHHINYMVTDIDDIGRAMNRLKAGDVPIVFGPGRHLPSTSIFLYFLDPDGNTAEFSFGMELFDETGARDARDLEHRADVMDIWGSRPDPRFGRSGPVLAAND